MLNHTGIKSLLHIGNLVCKVPSLPALFNPLIPKDLGHIPGPVGTAERGGCGEIERAHEMGIH